MTSWVRGSTLSILIVVCFLLPLISCSTSNRRSPAPRHQFFPNTRYGRRSFMPPLKDTIGGREMTVGFFGDGSVHCTYTGVEDYYKCQRKTTDYRPPSKD